MDNFPAPPNDNGSHYRPFRLRRGGRRNHPTSNQTSSYPFIVLRAPTRETPQASSFPQSTPNPTPSSTRPIHMRDMAVNPQAASPLYNGRIPPEIRNQIFKYAMVEYTETDEDLQYPKSTDYTRPGYTGRRAVTISLLLTCRKIYAEVYHLPPQNKEHVFWHERGPLVKGRNANFTRYQERQYFNLLAPWQLELVKEIHLFTQMYWLEEGLFTKLTMQDFMQGIKRLKITIRRGDWWWNERNAPLGINPQRGNGVADEMYKDWEAARRGEVIPWREGAWGTAFANLASLEELEMEFETSEDKLVELEKIVVYAKTWRFPLKDERVLSTEGRDAERMTWTGPPCLWSHRCPYCHSTGNCRGIAHANPKCLEKARRRSEGLGPDCTVFSLTWRVAAG